jgi:acyl carrier protein
LISVESSGYKLFNEAIRIAEFKETLKLDSLKTIVLWTRVRRRFWRPKPVGH